MAEEGAGLVYVGTIEELKQKGCVSVTAQGHDIVLFYHQDNVYALDNRCPDIFVIIIDEINRGNIPRIFGEAIYCLEYRGEGVCLPYSQNSFQIPSNLVIIGTMNSADRSIAFLDYAPRRRFAFVEFMPNNSIISKWFSVKYPDIDLDPLIELFEDINEKIVEWKGPEFQVGHSYFMPKQMTEIDFEAIWKYDIRPLLGEYFLNDEEKLEKFDELYTGFKEKMSQNEVQ